MKITRDNTALRVTGNELTRGEQEVIKETSDFQLGLPMQPKVNEEPQDDMLIIPAWYELRPQNIII